MAAILAPRAFSVARPRVSAAASTSKGSRKSALSLKRGGKAVVARAYGDEPEPAPTLNLDVSATCSIDDLDGDCSVADLEMLYVDALWNYYNGGEFTLADEDYDRVREELNWQGSGFPTLRRYEVEFVQAAISYARGEPVISDQQYLELKQRVASQGQKRDDVTALLLYTKGQQLLDADQYAQLADEMKKLGIEVGLRGATCTLSNTSDKLIADTGRLAKMYGALAILPVTIGLVPYIGCSLFGVDVPAAAGLGFALTFGAALTAKLVDYTGLQNGEILVGNCPCCETEIKQFFGGAEPPATFEYKCSVCGTSCELDREKQLILSAGGLSSM